LAGVVENPIRRRGSSSFDVEIFEDDVRALAAEFQRDALDPDGIVVDIALAGDALKRLLGALNFRNLDDEPAFRGKNTTTEFMAFVIFERMAAEIGSGALGPNASGLTALKVTLHESHVAWAAYEGPLRG